MPQVEIPCTEIQNEQSSSLSSLSSSNELFNFNDEGGLQSSQSSNNLSDVEFNILPLIHSERQPYETCNFPNEPSLDELLKQVSGTNDLASVEEIQLRIVSHTISLQRIHLFMPNLRVLNLEGSIVSSLRDLGCDIITLKYLNVSRCGLKSFDGTNGLGTLEVMIAEFNIISDISPCCSLYNLRKLNLKGNNIRTIDTITFLELCPKLKDLNLLENPVTKTHNYRNSVKEVLPNLTILDDVVFYEIQSFNEFSSSDYQSSTSTSPEISFENDATKKQNQRNNVYQKPTTEVRVTNSSSELTSGQPYCGNVISRRHRRLLAWADANDDANNSPSNSSSVSTKSFPNQLPQQLVSLELGVVGVQSFSGNSENWTTESLLEIARKWRYTSKTTRDTLNHYEELRNLGKLN